MSEKLLPCPLCGGCPVLTEAMTEHWVSCGTCGASGGMHGRLKLAIAAWNRHPLPVHSLSWDEIKTDDPARADRAYREADAILAALRPTDTGWRDIATAPINERILVWVTGKMMPGARFGSAYRGANGKVIAKPEGGNGDWTKEITYWMPLPSAPTDTGANHD